MKKRIGDRIVAMNGDSIICGDDKAECQKNMIRSKFK
jgi:hypothetical protein